MSLSLISRRSHLFFKGLQTTRCVTLSNSRNFSSLHQFSSSSSLFTTPSPLFSLSSSFSGSNSPFLRTVQPLITLTSSRRHFKSQSSVKSQPKPVEQEVPISVTFVTPEGEEKHVVGKKGQHLLEVAHQNNIDLEGACEASLACSTCHVIVDPAFYEMLKEPSDEENDMLDLAFGLTETRNRSRLGCQIVLDERLDNIRVTLPPATRNLAVDGYKPKPH